MTVIHIYITLDHNLSECVRLLLTRNDSGDSDAIFDYSVEEYLNKIKLGLRFTKEQATKMLIFLSYQMF